MPLLAALLRKARCRKLACALCGRSRVSRRWSRPTSKWRSATRIPALREHAVRLAEPHLNDDAILLNHVVSLADDETPRVRMQVAYSLGETKDPRAVDAIARIARRDGGDPWIRTAVLSSVAETSHELLIRLLAEPGFVASGTGADIAERLAYIVGVRNRPDEMATLLDAVATLLHPAERLSASSNRAGHWRRT